jgi:glycogen operon protein
MADRQSQDRLLSLIGANFEIRRGSPLPLGATVLRGGINFAIFSRHATSVRLALFVPGDEEPVFEFALHPHHNRTGDVWHVFVQGLDPGVEYAYRMNREPNEAPAIHRYDPEALLLDPYAKDVTGGERWGETPRFEPRRRNRRRCLLVDNQFDWGFDQPLNIPLADTVLYELHVRGFTRHPSSGVRQPGTFAGLAEKVPYLKELGVTAVELLPICEFEEADLDRVDPVTGERLLNFWGYQPISFFAPKRSYAASRGRSGEIAEFKEMVKQFHAAGIEVILDVVFNHTAEGDERGPTLNFRGIDNATYYIIDPVTGAYHNYSGCGNTLNCNHPVVRDLLLDVLRYWVTEMHVDGFRFDLASILGRGRRGEVLANPPLIERMAADPVLAHTKLIAEAWDAAGLYQVGSFPAWGRWAEWNGKFRDEVRRFVRGDEGMVPALAARLLGSPDLYRDDPRAPYHAINFVTCHDGFTLADLVSFNTKHNERNGENNADGANDNWSWNCGVEGPTTDPKILRLRARQQRNLIALLFMAHGVPMLLAGDEFGRTQQGNNNAYCQDNEISWVNWELARQQADLVRFVRTLIAFRKANSLLRPRQFVGDQGEGGAQVSWHGVRLGEPDWRPVSHSLAMHLSHPAPESGARDIYLIANAYWEPLEFQLPPLPQGTWHRLVDTGLEPPREITDLGAEEPLAVPGSYRTGPRTVVILVGKP